MGDRCYLEITYRKEDENHFVELWGEPWYQMVMAEGETWQTVSMEEANYGLLTDRQQLAHQGMCFLGWHAAGGDYGEAVFASFGGKHADVPGHEFEPHVPLKENGQIHERMLREARLYLDFTRKAREILGEGA